jgi:hypothetical protein
VLEPEIVVKMAGEVLLDAEEALGAAAFDDFAGRLRRPAEIAFLAVLLERHDALR